MTSSSASRRKVGESVRSSRSVGELVGDERVVGDMGRMAATLAAAGRQPGPSALGRSAPDGRMPVSVAAVPRCETWRDGRAGEAIDFAIAAYREDGDWQVAPLPPRAADGSTPSSTRFASSRARSAPSAWSSVDEDFFVAARVSGDDARLLLSDVDRRRRLAARRRGPRPPRAARRPRTTTTRRSRPATSAIFADLGLDAHGARRALRRPRPLSRRAARRIAGRLGFGEQFDDSVDAVDSTLTAAAGSPPGRVRGRDAAALAEARAGLAADDVPSAPSSSTPTARVVGDAATTCARRDADPTGARRGGGAARRAAGWAAGGWTAARWS